MTRLKAYWPGINLASACLMMVFAWYFLATGDGSAFRDYLILSLVFVLLARGE